MGIVSRNDVRDAIENSWSDFQNGLIERNLDGRTETIVEKIVAEVLDNIEIELGEQPMQRKYLIGTARTLDIVGAVVAVVLSWERNHSILWAIIHGFFGWWYVLYAYLFKQGE